jgi:hypothetical protein
VKLETPERGNARSEQCFRVKVWKRVTKEKDTALYLWAPQCWH